VSFRLSSYSPINLLITLSSVFDAKRLIGRKFADAEVQSDIKHFPFKVLDKSGKPYIRVQYRGEDKEFVRLIIS
jgi:molecular chaperone DnaK (HSP70)